ncbi:MAG: 1-deoxy-D-xylulose-5-phosphate reductoisomerase [Lachnospiraceae bacterium]|jgi:1-deoxy-D-xylulose-5-phosphate reductoisomerase|nr:1-deoxy-D-xylulose-5-phosphate reductoisomerase [Lachnospiraceae bacterium]
MKNISILGSTGSIGTQTLDVISQHIEEFNVTSLSCGSNIELLEKQIREFHPSFVSVKGEKEYIELKSRISDTDTEINYGLAGLIRVAEDPESDMLVTGIVGMLGIRPTLAAIKAGKNIALANKETLVCAGHLVMAEAKKNGVSIIPVDSEHSAIFQSLQGEENNKIEKIILTASGGPFRGKKREELENVSLDEVLYNPNWSMGKKVTIDSAGMINKGLEVMEAGWLFGVNRQQIQVVVHPESVLHSAVEFQDGAVMGQLGAPDMRIPIQYALFYPNRPSLSAKKLDFWNVGVLHFEKPDMDTFTGLKLAMNAMDEGGNIPTVFNSSNEEAVRMLLQGKISFLDIPKAISYAMGKMERIDSPSVEEILYTEDKTINLIREFLK